MHRAASRPDITILVFCMNAVAIQKSRKSFTYMYEQFYNVRTNPFALTPDPEYLFLSDEQREAIASLMYAVLARRGFSVLIGDAGTGKTTLLRALMRSVPESRAVFSVVVNPTLSPAEFLRTCVADFGIETGECAKDVCSQSCIDFLSTLIRTTKSQS